MHTFSKRPYIPMAPFAILFMFALACNLTSGPQPVLSSPTVPPAGEPDETLLALGSLFDEEGRFPVQAAQEIFAAAVAPLPGVTPRELPGTNKGAAAEIAVQSLFRNRSELTLEVIAALDEALFGGVTDEIEIQSSVSAGKLALLRPSLSGMELAQPSDDLTRARALVEDLRSRIEARSGLALRSPIRIGISRRPAGTIEAEATPVAPTGRLEACRIVFFPGVLDNPVNAEFVVAHELWHCFQFEHAGLDDRGAWIDEGQAEWVAAEVASDPSPVAGRWNTWLGAPHVSLWGRSYDAMGLYAAAQAAGFDPFDVMIEMYHLGNQEAVSRLFGGMPIDEALQIVAMSLVRAPAFGAEWEATGPGITGNRATQLFEISLASEEYRIAVGNFGSLPLELQVGEGDLLQISASGAVEAGAVEFPDAGLFPLESGSSMLFCLREDECTCPDGSVPGGGEPPPMLSDPNGVATVASLNGGEVSLVAGLLSLEDACRQLVGTWESTLDEIMAANLAPYGGMPAGSFSCEGPYILIFGADGSFEGHYEGACRFFDKTGNASGSANGTYMDQGTNFTLQGVSASGGGSIDIEGMPPLPSLFNQFTAATAPIPYTIEGDRLTYSFTTPDGRIIEHGFNRVE